MNNNSNCDSCSGMMRNRMEMRNQMDMRCQKNAVMSGCPQGQIMPRTNAGYNDCGDTTDNMRGKAIAMAYVPWQQFECTYEPMQALHAGTVFPELEKPFYGRRGIR